MQSGSLDKILISSPDLFIEIKQISFYNVMGIILRDLF